ncbi:MAG: cell division protein FtsH, partial [Hyphomicrobiales bacterium]|nr:cell division protein FtsH [Hyphomicrobiales bacterium]
GPISFGSNPEVFLGRDFVKERDFSEETASAVDKEIHKLLEEAYADARKIVNEHKEILIAIAEELFERETLDTEEIDEIIRGAGGKDLMPLRGPKKNVPPTRKNIVAPRPGTEEPDVDVGTGGGEPVPGTA